MNLFADKPDLKEWTHREVWECPLTGLRVPKNSDANLKWRAELLEAAEKDPELRQDLYTACSQSILFFINAFCMTRRVFETKEGRVTQSEFADVPFVTWEIQDTHILELENAIDTGEELLTDKSRDMGATWDHIIVLVHQFLFRDSKSFLMISRKEDALDVLDGLPKNYPDGPLSDPGTLFGKIDYVLSFLPEWMLPSCSRKKLHLVNNDNGSRIDGESSNATAGSSDRRTAIFLDEFAKVDEAESIKRSTRDVTACRLVCSTPNGPGTTFSKWRLGGGIRVFVLPWWEHPEKGYGRNAKQDSNGKWFISSPWYEKECLARSPKEVAIELNMDHVGSGDTFFEATTIEQHRRLFARGPKYKLTIDWRKKYSDSDIAAAACRSDKLTMVRIRNDSGPTRVWCELRKRPDELMPRPDQSRSYILGVDISKGQGASNSCISVLCEQTKEKVMEYADPNVPPHELARIAVAMAVWIGGCKRPLIIWENNGDPGFDFGRQLVHTYHYPSIYFDKQSGTLREKAGKRYGWRSSPEKKAAALGLLRRAYAHGRYRNPSSAALDECLSYVYYESGGIGPAALVEEADAARKAHGDRVIADMLTLVGTADFRDRKELRVAPKRSFAARLSAFKSRKKQRESRNQKAPEYWGEAVAV